MSNRKKNSNFADFGNSTEQTIVLNVGGIKVKKRKKKKNGIKIF
jgi:hypothetical protein